jgi:hypothetical protein
MTPTRTLAACLVTLALPLAAWSQDSASSPSRAEVKQEGQQALKSGQTPVGDKVANKPDMSTKSTTTRAQVKSDAASGGGQQHDLGNTQRSSHTTKSTSTKSRQQVKSEAQQANREGDIPTGDLGKGSGPDIANTPANRKAAAAASAASK